MAIFNPAGLPPMGAAFTQHAMMPGAGAASGAPSLAASIMDPMAEQAFIMNIMKDFMQGSMAFQAGFAAFAGQAMTNNPIGPGPQAP